MYERKQKSARSTRTVGAVAALALTAGMAGMFATMNLSAEKAKLNSMELVLLSPPPPPPPIEKPKPPKVEVVEDTPAPPETPPLVAPELDFVPEEIPVITAPVADPIPLPPPIPVAPAPPAVQSSSTPKLIASRKPEYPPSARRAGEHGVTRLEVCVNTSGRVTQVSVARTSGSPRLDDAAVKWIRGERFTPARVNGVAQEVCGHDVYYEWTLRDA